jgi:hypothetical protein
MLSRVCFGCGLAVLAITGCQSYSPYGYGPMGTYGYPAGGAMPPGTTYVTPPMSVPQGSMAPSAPGTTIGAMPAGPRASQSEPSHLYGQAPGQIQPKGSSTNGGSTKGLVPEYDDPSAPATLGKPTMVPEVQDEAEFQRKDPTGAFTNERLDEQGSLPNQQIPTTEPFEQPVPFQPASFTQEVAAGEPEASPERPNPYAHDAQKFSWFRGVADYDEQAQAWYVVYNPEAASSDPYGGSITLAANPKLNVLHRNDVVLVKGKMSEEKLDRFGKPVFQIDVAHRLVPKKPMSASADVAETTAEPQDLFTGP